MKKRIASILTGICAMALVCSAGSAIYFAKAEKAAVTEQSVLTMREGASIRYFDPVGIRFVTDIALDKYTEITTADADATFGTLIIPADVLGGQPLTLKTEEAVNIVAEKWFEDTASTKSFTGCLVGADKKNGTFEDFPETYYDKDLCAVSYCSYNDTVIYADNPQTYSVAYIASALQANGETDTLLSEITDSVLNDGIFFKTEPQTMSVGETFQTQLEAKGLKAVYTSSDEAVATVNEQGVITAVSKGDASITAKIGGKSATVDVVVKNGSPKLVFDDFETVNGQYVVKFTTRDIAGATIPMPRAIGADGVSDESGAVTVTCVDSIIDNNKFDENISIGAYTLTYSVTDEATEMGEKTVTETATLYVYRELFAENSSDVILNNDFIFDNNQTATELDDLMVKNQSVKLLSNGITDVSFNAPAGKVYYAEAEFELALGLDSNGDENIFADISVGLSHKAEGKPVFFAAVDRNQRDAYTGEYTKDGGIKEYDPNNNYGTVYAHPYVLKIDKTRKTDTGSAKTVKIAVMRDNNDFYLFVNDKYVMCSNRPEYADIDTVPALFGKNIKQSNGDSFAKTIVLLSGADATGKLSDLLGEGKQNMISGYAYNQGENGSECIADGNMDVSYTVENGITVNYKKADGNENTAKMGSYMYFYGDFTFSFVYKTTSAQKDSSMYVSAFPMLFDNMAYANQLFELGVKYNSKDAAQLLLTRSHATNDRNVSENHPFVAGSDKMPFNHSKGIKYTVKRHVFDRYAQYILVAESVADSTQRATRTFTWAWDKVDERLRYDAPVMLVFKNIAITGTYSNITWDDEAVTPDWNVQDTGSVSGTKVENLKNNNAYPDGNPDSAQYKNVSVHTVDGSANQLNGKYKVVIEYSTADKDQAYGLVVHMGHGQEYRNQEYMFDIPLEKTTAGKYIVLEVDLGREYIRNWNTIQFYITCKSTGGSYNDVYRSCVTIHSIELYKQV